MTAVVRWRTSWLVPLAFAVSFAAPGCDGMETRMRDSGATEAEMSQVRSMAADWRWKHRLLVVAVESDDVRFDRQRAMVTEASEEWLDRNLLLIMLAGEEGWVIDDPSAARSGWKPLSAGEAAAFRRRYDLGDVLGDVEFEAVLVGKDGGVKNRYREIVDPSAIFPFIDAMPMRMDEMRE